jgi:predicted RNA-binding Zn-ribbon protein involved in translation (DUF1610 family)
MNTDNTDHGIFVPNEDAQSDTITTEPCPQCGKRFKPGASLRMHIVRIHGKGWDTGANFKKGQKAKSREEQLERKRIYQLGLRARYYAQGRNSRGEKMPKGWKPRPRGGNAGLRLPPWTPQRMAKFRRTMREKAKLRNRSNEAIQKRIQIVYPDPRQEQEKITEAIRNTWPETERDNRDVTIPAIKFCPNCGEHLEGWRHV